MLEVAKCRECGEIKPCIPIRGLKPGGISGVSHYCPECDDEIDEWLDDELDRWLDISREIFLYTSNRQN